MRAKAEIEVACTAHAHSLARTLRPEERDELDAAGLEPLEAILSSMRRSDAAWAALVDGQVGAMFGVGPVEGVAQPVGQVWFLTGTAFLEHPLAYARVAKRVIAVLLKFYPVLFNLIDARYAAALRWARWLKFAVGETATPYGPAGRMFLSARLTRTAWAR